MFITAPTLDDLLQKTLKRVLRKGAPISSERGNSRELIGVMLELQNPRARLSRSETKGKVFSGLGELLWYLSGQNNLDFIEYYIPKYRDESEDGKTIYGGYGPRLHKEIDGVNQIDNAINILTNRGDSRRAVIQIFDAKDIVGVHKEIPCTCVIQLLRRNDLLHMVVYMRSNDAFLGLSHDIFAFTMLQEMIAKRLNIEIGKYRHSVGSLHLYERQVNQTMQYLNEGWQSTDLNASMPSMPDGDPWQYIPLLLDNEQKIRLGQNISLGAIRIPPYWKDFLRLLKIFGHGKSGDVNEIKKIYQLKRQMASTIFDIYIDTYYSRRRTQSENTFEDSKQMSLEGIIKIDGLR